MLFPRNPKTPKNGESSASDYQSAIEAGHDGKVKNTRSFFPISNKIARLEEGKVSDYTSEEAAYRKLRDARSEARNIGKREKRAKAKEEEAAASKK